uniref:Reverse transcriptase Ty1/copia-type domain-containing protein n=1 Tax=Fagus sylvatica TaxID=28930 RepID=A0A2N9HDB3_FAGSY
MNLQPHPHPMRTRSRDNIVQPKQFYPGIIRYPLPKALLTLTASTPPEPSCFTEASKSAEWRAAMATEFTALLKNSTWTLVPPKPNTNVVGCKWVFRIKRDAAGTIERYKARLVAKGFHQQHGVDYGDTFSPVIKPVTIRTVLSLAIASNWDIRQLDVTNAFLHGVLSEDVYMTQPAGFVHPSYPHHVCHLRKALYGLKQAPRAWYSRLSTRLLDLGFKGCKSDTSLFIYRSGPELILFLIYVDDIIITGTNSTSITRLINTLQGDFALKDLGPLHFFLGVEAHKVDSGMYLSQRRYITDLLRKTNLHQAKPVASPMASSTILSQHTGTSLSDPSLYRSVVGSLQYLSLTRPDISFAVNKVCQFMANPTEDHWSAVKRILRYLKHTIHHCIFLHRDTNFNIQAFSDADWASCPDDRRSTTGYCLFLGRNLISWTSRKQRTVSRSSTESEYRAVAHASTEIIWLCSLLSELGIASSTPPLLWCDNIGATYLTANPLFHARTKHIEIDVHFVRDLVASKALSIRFISSKDQLADTFTKPLPTAKFTLLRDNLNVRELPLRLRGHIRTALPISVTDTSLKSTDKEQLHQQDIHKS